MDQNAIDVLMEQYREPAIMLRRVYPPGTARVARSFVGGLPVLPPGSEWPRTSKGVPLHFLAQIDCAELPPSDDLLPDRGVLFFFARVDDIMDWGQGDPQESCRVIFAPAAGDSPVAAPDDLPSIQGGYAAFERDLLLPGEPPFTVYPRWPVEARAIQSWPDETAIPRYWEKDLEGYQQAVGRARAGEAVVALGRPVNAKVPPHWGKDPSENSIDAQVRLPSDDERPFPQVWVMVDRIARYLANQARQHWEREGEKRPEEPSSFDTGHLQAIYDASVTWVETARGQGLPTAPSDDDRRRFREWLSALASDESRLIRHSVDVAIKVGMGSAVQFAAASLKAADLIPSRYYHELESEHLPTLSADKGKLASCPSYHQMLGRTGSSQEAVSVESDEVMLLQLTSDYGVNFMFCDVGEAEFWIRKDDLAVRRFDRVRATTMGG